MCTSAQTNERHVSSITTKSSDIISNPFKQQDLIPESQIEQSLLVCQLRVQEAQSTNTVIEAHSHKRLGGPSNHTGCIVHFCSSTVEGSAVDVDHYGDFLI